MKQKSLIRISIGVLAGSAIFVGTIWMLSQTLGNQHEELYAGKPQAYWQEQLQIPGTSNEAFSVVTTQVIPRLTDATFHDTNDSILRLKLVSALNTMPGVQIVYFDASSRRGHATANIGLLGPAGKSAIPALMQVLKGNDKILYEPAIQALGHIHSDPDVVIPFLITFLDNDEVNDEAALALAEFGSQAKPAVPKIIPLLHAEDRDVRAAAATALLKIDSEAAEKAGVGVRATPALKADKR